MKTTSQESVTDHHVLPLNNHGLQLQTSHKSKAKKLHILFLHGWPDVVKVAERPSEKMEDTNSAREEGQNGEERRHAEPHENFQAKSK